MNPTWYFVFACPYEPIYIGRTGEKTYRYRVQWPHDHREPNPLCRSLYIRATQERQREIARRMVDRLNARRAQ